MPWQLLLLQSNDLHSPTQCSERAKLSESIMSHACVCWGWGLRAVMLPA